MKNQKSSGFLILPAIGFFAIAEKAAGQFVSYHDFGATAGWQSTGHITTHQSGTGSVVTLDTSAKILLNFADGSSTGVSFRIAGANAMDARNGGETGPPAAATPAGGLFNVAGLNLNNGLLYEGGNGGSGATTLTLVGLAPDFLYDVALYGHRSAGADGVERFTLTGAESATNLASAGIINEFVTDQQTRPNAASGHVIRWTDIVPGADGTIIIEVDPEVSSPSNIAYLAALRLEGTPTGPDLTPPLLTTTNPVDDAIEVPILSKLVMTFSEAVRKGSGEIVIKRSSDGAIVTTIPINSPEVTVNGTLVTIDPAVALLPGTVHDVEIASGVIEDLAGNPFGGNGGSLSWNFTTQTPLVLDRVVVSEFMASNQDALLDGDGNSSDWIEIWNSTRLPVDLHDWTLTDDLSDLDRWPLPAITLQPDEYLVVFASGQPFDTYRDGDGFAHSNFKLSKSPGGDLALVDGSGTIVDAYLSYPEQYEDISYGLHGVAAPLPAGYLTESSPGFRNGSPSFSGFVSDTTFSHHRGFHSAPFNLVISTATPGATIRYTTDGSEPSGTNGNDYPGGAGLPISTTTIVRAAAFKEEYRPTNIDTQTYLFLEDVIRQPTDPPGVPLDWDGYGSDFEMDPEVVNDPVYSEEIIPGLKSIPTLSIVSDPASFWSPQDGIYIYPTREGLATERPVSLEWINPDGTTLFQEEAGIRIYGGSWRKHSASLKHSFQLKFKSEYGESKLRYPIFPDAPVEAFDDIVLRAQGSRGWAARKESTTLNAQFIHDDWARDTARDMGKVDGHSTHVHLYLNGLYFGLYNPVERPSGNFGEEYFGGSNDDYDHLKISRHDGTAVEAKEGDLVAWNEMQALANAGLNSPAAYAAIQEYVDIDNLIDYMLINQYATNRDGPASANNMSVLRKREPGEPFRFYVWDMEFTFWNQAENSNVNVDTANTITRIYARLRSNAEFRLRYADAVHRHLFNDGALTPTAAAARWQARADEISSAVVAESARWGDFLKPDVPYTRDGQWTTELNRLMTEYFPQRGDYLLDDLRAARLYPEVGAPEFGHFGGSVPTGFALMMNAPDGGTIYYTLDGSDPREAVTGAPLGSAYQGSVTLSETGTVKARVRSAGNEWSALTAASFVVGTPASAASVAVSEIMYHPVGGTSHEYLELINFSSETIDLTGAKFTAGITFEFPVNTTLAPGARILLVKDAAAFELRYGSGHPVVGQYTGQLDNGGEQLRVEDFNGAVILDFSYGDDSPWPESPDGEGPSLVFIAPDGAAGNSSDPFSWRPSVTLGGTPGETDSVFFSGVESDDLDSDGIQALMEHALGSSDTIADQNVLPTVGIGRFAISGDGPPAEFLTFTYRHNLAADDVIYTIQTSIDAATWSSNSAATLFVSSVDTGRGYALATYRIALPLTSTAKRFLRLKVSKR